MKDLIEKWAGFIIKKRRLVIVLILIITGISLLGFRHLYFYNKFTSWLAPDDPVTSLFIKSSEKFSTNELVLILIQPEGGVFRKEILGKIKTFTEKMKRRREIFLAISLGNIADIKKIKGGIEAKNLLENIPETPPAMAEFKEYVLSKESFRGNVISADGEWAALSIFISSDYDSEEVVKSIIYPETEKFFSQDTKIFFAGIPSDAHFLNRFAIDDLSLLTPLIFVIIALILFFSFRSWKGVLFPSLVVLLSSIWLFGLIGHTRAPLTFITTAIPVLLTALGSAYGIHVLNKFNHDISGPAIMQKDRLVKSTAVIFIPVILAGLTTVVGFLSFQSVRLNLVADFGLYAAVGILFALIIALTLIPALSVTVRFKERQPNQYEGMSGLLSKSAKFVIEHKVAVFLTFLAILCLFAFGIPRIRKEINFVEYFPHQSHPRLAHNIVEREFNGAYPVYFYIKAANAKEPGTLRVLRRCENFLLGNNNLSIPGSIVSLIQELNFQLNDRYAVPETVASVGNLWFFVDGRDEVRQLLSEENTETVVFAKNAESSTSNNKHLANRISAFLDQDFRRGVFSYNTITAPADAKSLIFQEELEFLKDEVCWLARRYLDRQADPEEIQTIMSQVSALMETPAPESVLELQKREIGRYIASENFEFLINTKIIERITLSAAHSLETGSFRKDRLVSIFKSLIPPDEFDLPTADMAAETLIYKINEIRENWAVDSIWARLNRRFNSNNRDFEKRVKSIVFDLLDEIAVIPVKKMKGIAGQRIKIDQIDHSGIPALLTRLDQFLTTSQIQSLVLAYFITLVLMIIMRRSFILGLISTIPIVMTITIIYGFLGHSGTALDYATMMTGGVSIGVGIDYAIHFIHGVLEGTDNGLSLEQAIHKSTVEKGKAILANAIAVIAGFAVLLLSTMVILRNFGVTMIGSMFLAALTTLTILPATLLILGPFFIKRSGGVK